MVGEFVILVDVMEVFILIGFVEQSIVFYVE